MHVVWSEELISNSWSFSFLHLHRQHWGLKPDTRPLSLFHAWMISLLLSGWSYVWTFWSVLPCFFDHFNGYVMALDSNLGTIMLKNVRINHGVVCVCRRLWVQSHSHPFLSLQTMALITHTCAHTHTLPHARNLQFGTASSQTVFSVHGKQNRQPQVPQHGEETKKEAKAARRRKKKKKSIIQQSGKTRCDWAYRLLSFISSHPVVSLRASEVRRMEDELGHGHWSLSPWRAQPKLQLFSHTTNDSVSLTNTASGGGWVIVRQPFCLQLQAYSPVLLSLFIPIFLSFSPSCNLKIRVKECTISRQVQHTYTLS